MCEFSNLNVLLVLFLVFVVASSGPNEAKEGSNKKNYLRFIGDQKLKYRNNDPCVSLSPKLPDFRAPGRSVSEVKCFEYVWRANIGKLKIDQEITCLLRKHKYNRKWRHRIWGGENAILSDFAHMGALGWRTEDGTWSFKCGGSLISDKFVVTAAHCTSVPRRDFTVMELVPKIVRLGVVTINNNNKLELSNVSDMPTDAVIKQIIKHPQYNPPRRYYDIALIELEKEIEFQWIVHPACLHTSFNVPNVVSVTGWGASDSVTMRTSPNLQVAQLNIIESSNCDKLLHWTHNRHWDGLAQHQICAGHLAGGIDTCQGDSGGPLQYLIGNDFGPVGPPNTWSMHRIVAVTSFGYKCGHSNTPGVYTRVANFARWIESIVWPNDYNISSVILFPDQLRT